MSSTPLNLSGIWLAQACVLYISRQQHTTNRTMVMRQMTNVQCSIFQSTGRTTKWFNCWFEGVLILSILLIRLNKYYSESNYLSVNTAILFNFAVFCIFHFCRPATCNFQFCLTKDFVFSVFNPAFNSQFLSVFDSVFNSACSFCLVFVCFLARQWKIWCPPSETIWISVFLSVFCRNQEDLVFSRCR